MASKAARYVPKPSSLLSGLLRCAVCGSTIVHRVLHRRRSPYHVCSAVLHGQKRTGKVCSLHFCPETQVEHVVFE
ncbi:MAG: zinc ribbon domain-containing protein [Bacillota bacterium]